MRELECLELLCVHFDRLLPFICRDRNETRTGCVSEAVRGAVVV